MNIGIGRTDPRVQNAKIIVLKGIEFPVQHEHYHCYDLVETVMSEDVDFVVFKWDCTVGEDGRIYGNPDKIVIETGI